MAHRFGGADADFVCLRPVVAILGLTRRSVVSTLEQSPESRRYGSDPRCSGPAPVTSETQSLCGLGIPRSARCQMQRGESRGEGQADFPAEQPAPSPRAWLSAADADPGRPGDCVQPAAQGTPRAYCLIRHRCPSGASCAEPHDAVIGFPRDGQARDASRATRPRRLCTPGRDRIGSQGGLDHREIGGLCGAAASGGPPATAHCARCAARIGPGRSSGDPRIAEQSQRDVGSVAAPVARRVAAGLSDAGACPVTTRQALAWRRWVRNAGARCARGLIFLIQLYRHLVSPLRLPSCRFTPTCSQYAVEALSEYGLMRGCWLAAVRLAKCGPWDPGGWDPIPEPPANRGEWVTPVKRGDASVV